MKCSFALKKDKIKRLLRTCVSSVSLITFYYPITNFKTDNKARKVSQKLFDVKYNQQ